MTDDQIVVAAGVGSGCKSELARGVAAQEIALHDTAPNDITRLGGHTLVVEGRRRLSAPHVGLLANMNSGRKHLFAEAVEKERRLAVQAAAADRMDEMTDQA